MHAKKLHTISPGSSNESLFELDQRNWDSQIFERIRKKTLEGLTKPATSSRIPLLDSALFFSVRKCDNIKRQISVHLYKY